MADKQSTAFKQTRLEFFDALNECIAEAPEQEQRRLYQALCAFKAARPHYTLTLSKQPFFAWTIEAVEEALHVALEMCSICGKPCDRYGHNAQPINNGRCCDDCNNTVVIPERLRRAGLSEDQIERFDPSDQ
jgi:hypothetical protein